MDRLPVGRAKRTEKWRRRKPRTFCRSRRHSADLPNPGGNSTAGQDYPVTNLKPGGTYTVGDGETLYGICFKLYGNIRHLDDILAVNHLTDENRIIAGQTLVLPDVSGE